MSSSISEKLKNKIEELRDREHDLYIKYNRMNMAERKKETQKFEKEIKSIEKKITSLMRNKIEIEVDFINKNDLSLLENIGLTQKICEEKIVGACARLIDRGFSNYNYKDRFDDFMEIQKIIEKYWGYCKWEEDDEGRYYYDDYYTYNVICIPLIEYYYMLNHFNIDFEKIHMTLNKNPDHKDTFIHDYKYVYLYKEIGGNNFFKKSGTIC